MGTTLAYNRIGIIGPKSRQRVRLDVAVSPPPGANPWNHETRWGSYHACLVRDGAVWVQASYHGGPPFWHDTEAVPSDASYPRLAMDTTRRLWLVWQRTVAGVDDVLVARSDDEGATWEEGAVAFAGGTHPTVAVGSDGTIILMAVVSGVLQYSSRGPGDASFSAAANVQYWDGAALADLAVEDDTFHISQERGPQARWWLHCLPAGATDTAHLWSSDGGETYTEAT